ncbi:hypothetical protein CsatB_007951 [Cannabis sativa]
MEGIWFRLGFLNGAAVSSGASGGLALFWRRSWDIHVIESDFNKILVRFGGNGNTGDWVGCFTYAPPRRDARMVFWRDLCATMGSFTDPWIVMGDLNSVLSPDDKSGGRPVSRSEGQGLREFMFNLGAVDLESGSVLFTWTNGKDLDRLIRERLDRVVVSSSWLFLFKKVGVRNLPIHFSDHGAITLDTHMERENVVTPFRYLDAWSRDPDRRRVIEEAWREAIGGFHSFIPCQKLSFTAKALKVWNANVFGHCQTKIKALEKLLCEVQKRPPSNENVELEGTIMLELEESTNFQEIFTFTNPRIDDDLGDLIPRSILDEENSLLCVIPLEDEVKKVVWSMPPLKSPGPDGFPIKFFKLYWDIVGSQVVEFVKEFFHSGKFCKMVNKSFIVLIPKKAHACRFDDFRPISLCNSINKIDSKILANRLSSLLDKLVSPFQATFVKGRNIAENSIIANKIFHDMTRQRGREAFVGIKCDMSKAYDRLEWNFLLKVLKAFGFNNHFCDMIMFGVTSVSFQVLINGGITKKFVPNRGLRQGDLLYPLLFILYAEVLSKLLLAKEEEGLICGYSIGREGFSITHLMYADDLLIFAKAENGNVTAILDALDKYCYWSGQQINVRKSKVFFSKNCPLRCRDSIKNLLGFEEMNGGERFLGNPLLFKGNRSKDFDFIIDKTSSRFEGWRARLLSQAARLTLIKSVLAAIPIYTMSVFKLPKKTTNRIDGIIRRFWWTGQAKDGRYLSLKAWDSLCKPKSCGGLGFRRAEDINFCLLAKFGWTLASKQTCLWKSILLDRYYHETAFGDSVLPSNASPVAKSIWATKDFIVKNSVWLIGREAKVKIGNHQWSGFDGDLIDSGCLNPMMFDDLCVRNLMMEDGLSWNGQFDDVCKRIWKTRIHERLKLFLWRLAQDVLPFGSKLASIFGPNIGRCMLCGLGEMDVVSHFVSGCDVTRSLWFSSLWGLRIQRFNLVGSREVVSLLLEPRFLNDCGGKILNEFFLYGAILYHKLWNVRNDIFHNKGVLSLAEVRKAIDLSFAEHKPLLNVGWDIESNQRGICAVRWGLPRPARMRCYVDFASARDDGAVAAVSYDVAGDIFVAVASKVRVHSVLQGELEAVRFGLNMAALLEVDVGTFFSDN